MKTLKEYSGVITAIVVVLSAMASLTLWAIHVQVKPEIARLEARFEARFDLMDEKFRQVDARFEQIDARFDRVEGDIKTIRQDIKTILLRLPAPPEAG